MVAVLFCLASLIVNDIELRYYSKFGLGCDLYVSFKGFRLILTISKSSLRLQLFSVLKILISSITK